MDFYLVGTSLNFRGDYLYGEWYVDAIFWDALFDAYYTILYYTNYLNINSLSQSENIPDI